MSWHLARPWNVSPAMEVLGDLSFELAMLWVRCLAMAFIL